METIKKPLNLGEPGAPIRTSQPIIQQPPMTTTSDTDFTARLQIPIFSQIDSVLDAVDRFRQNPNANDAAEEIERRAVGLKAVYSAVAEVQKTVGHVASVAVPAAAILQATLPPVPTSTNKTVWESKKFIALGSAFAAAFAAPLAGKLGVSEETVRQILEVIMVAAIMYIGGQSVVDAVAAKQQKPPQQ